MRYAAASPASFLTRAEKIKEDIREMLLDDESQVFGVSMSVASWQLLCNSKCLQ